MKELELQKVARIALEHAARHPQVRPTRTQARLLRRGVLLALLLASLAVALLTRVVAVLPLA